MMVDVIIEKLDDVHLKFHCDGGIAMEFNEYFSFFAPGYKWMPKYKNNIWDGKIRLFSMAKRTLYTGLVYEAIRFCIDREYTFKVDPALGLGDRSVTATQAFVQSLKLPFTPYNYQDKALQVILDKKRRLILSPTASGKSLMIYMATRYLIEKKLANKILLVVPSTNLVEQMCGDFDNYAQNVDWHSDDHVNKIYDYDGVTKDTDKGATVSTWQSIFKLSKKWFQQFDAVFVDEAHLASANSIKGIMENLRHCEYRIGMTGTINDTQTHKLVLQGLFGKIFTTTTTKEMMDMGIASQLTIKGIVLNYPDVERKSVAYFKYQDEIETIVSDQRRNNMLHRLACSQDGNVLLLFNRVEGHGIPLAEQMEADSNGRKIMLVHGGIEAEERELIRKYAEEHNNVVICASFGVFSVGVNIKNLQYIIFAHPYKSKIKNLQSIGRGLRITAESNDVTLYDVADLYQWKRKVNTTYKHFKERLRLYDNEGFDYNIIQMDIK